MSTTTVNDARLFYRLRGSGNESMVLVHGSWDSHQDWDLVAPALAGSFRLVAYDRRGHSASERFPDQGSVREDVADLAGLIERLELAPVWIVGNSFGGSIALRLAAERPDLIRGLSVHEPPLLGLLADDPDLVPVVAQVKRKFEAVAERIAGGDHAGAAQEFVEEVALGPEMWDRLPAESRRSMIENAPTFLDEVRDPEQIAFDLEWIREFPRPTMLTRGGESPPMFAAVVGRLAETLPEAEVVTFPDAGHVPHVTHPAAYSETILGFTNRHPA